MADLDDLLRRTSRTFALSIPLLPEPTRERVAIAYLLFRIADTFEDAARWSRERRVVALIEFGRLLDTPSGAADRAAAWAADPPIRHEGYVDLLRGTPAVLAAFHRMPPDVRARVREPLGRTVAGMAEVVRGADAAGRIRLRDRRALRHYCHLVAGIVGEMLTELFLLESEALGPAAAYLRRRARFFGEGLQLVNILRDASADLDEGRSFLPPSVSRASLHDLARRDLRRAAEYTEALRKHRAPAGVVSFCGLPIVLATATLEVVSAHGAGAKLSRGEVAALVARWEEAMAAEGDDALRHALRT